MVDGRGPRRQLADGALTDETHSPSRRALPRSSYDPGVSDEDATTHSAWGEIIDESGDYVFAMTESGWAVWDRFGSKEPLVQFPLSDEGFDLASEYFARAKRASRGRRGRAPRALRSIAIVAGCVWITSTAIVQMWVYVLNDPVTGFDGSSAVLRWAQALSTIAYPVFVVAIGAYVLSWMRNRGGLEPAPASGLTRAGNTEG
jgi:hypothetical protein